ncbi:unnamed protein product [Ectocarpus sp. 4 AP-2014]
MTGDPSYRCLLFDMSHDERMRQMRAFSAPFHMQTCIYHRVQQSHVRTIDGARLPAHFLVSSSNALSYLYSSRDLPPRSPRSCPAASSEEAVGLRKTGHGLETSTMSSQEKGSVSADSSSRMRRSCCECARHKKKCDGRTPCRCVMYDLLR